MRTLFELPTGCFFVFPENTEVAFKKLEEVQVKGQFDHISVCRVAKYNKKDGWVTDIGEPEKADLYAKGVKIAL